MDIINEIGPLIEIILTWFTFTLALWGENPLHRLAERVYVPSVTGYFFTTAAWFAYNSCIIPILGGKWYYIIALILGFMLFFRYNRNYVWLYRISMGYMVGINTGLAMRAVIGASIIQQIKATILPLTTPDPLTNFNNMLLIIFTITSITVFVFGRKISGPLKYSRNFGRYIIFAAMGATFGNTMLYRYSTFIGRIGTIFGYHQGISATVIGVLVAITLIVLNKLGKAPFSRF